MPAVRNPESHLFNLMSVPASLLRMLAVILLAAGVARAATLVLDVPVAGYANQFDMLRVSACLGLWPMTTQDPRRASPKAPIATYRVDRPEMESCFPSSAVLMAWLGLQTANLLGGEEIDLRWIGGIKLALLCLIAVLLHVTLHRFPAAAFGHAAVFLLVISWDYVAASWGVREASGEAGGLPFLYLLKSLLLVLPVLLLLQAWVSCRQSIRILRD